MKGTQAAGLGLAGVLGIFFPPIWFMAAGKIVSDSHTKERKESGRKRRRMTAPNRRSHAAHKRVDRNMAAYWRNKYQDEHKRRVGAENTNRSNQAARKKEVQEHEKTRKSMAGMFVRIVTICNETRSRMPGRLDKIRALGNAGRGL